MKVQITTGERRKTGMFGGGSSEYFLRCKITLTPAEEAVLQNSGTPALELTDPVFESDDLSDLILWENAIKPNGAEKTYVRLDHLYTDEQTCVARCQSAQAYLKRMVEYEVDKTYEVDFEKLEREARGRLVVEYLLIIIVLVGGGIALAVVSANSTKDAKRRALQAAIEKIKDDLIDKDDDDTLGVALLTKVAEISNRSGRIIGLDNLFFLSKVITLMFQASKVSPDKCDETIGKLQSRIDRRLDMNFDAERRSVEDLARQQEKWIESTAPLIAALVPLFPLPDEFDDDDAFVGDVYTSTGNLLGQASDPHAKIYKICSALTQIEGSGFGRAQMPDYGDIKQRRGDPDALAQKILRQDAPCDRAH